MTHIGATARPWILDRRHGLSMDTLSRARVSLVRGPTDLRPKTITHLGIGALVQARLGVYAVDLNRRSWLALIRGISLMSDRAE
jgi:hypothetical protein